MCISVPLMLITGEGGLRFREVKTMQIFQERTEMSRSYLFTQKLITLPPIYFYEYFKL